MKDSPLTARRRSRLYQQALAVLRERHRAEFDEIFAGLRSGRYVVVGLHGPELVVPLAAIRRDGGGV